MPNILKSYIPACTYIRDDVCVRRTVIDCDLLHMAQCEMQMQTTSRPWFTPHQCREISIARVIIGLGIAFPPVLVAYKIRVLYSQASPSTENSHGRARDRIFGCASGNSLSGSMGVRIHPTVRCSWSLTSCPCMTWRRARVDNLQRPAWGASPERCRAQQSRGKPDPLSSDLGGADAANRP